MSLQKQLKIRTMFVVRSYIRLRRVVIQAKTKHRFLFGFVVMIGAAGTYLIKGEQIWNVFFPSASPEDTYILETNKTNLAIQGITLTNWADDENPDVTLSLRNTSAVDAEDISIKILNTDGKVVNRHPSGEPKLFNAENLGMSANTTLSIPIVDSKIFQDSLRDKFSCLPSNFPTAIKFYLSPQNNQSTTWPENYSCAWTVLSLSYRSPYGAKTGKLIGILTISPQAS